MRPRSVVNPTQARARLDAVAHLADPDDPDRRQPALAACARRLVAFFGCMYYAALRPSEALALTVDDLELPDPDDPDGDGWGHLFLSRSNAEVSATSTDTGRREPRQLNTSPPATSGPCPAHHRWSRSCASTAPLRAPLPTVDCSSAPTADTSPPRPTTRSGNAARAKALTRRGRLRAGRAPLRPAAHRRLDLAGWRRRLRPGRRMGRHPIAVLHRVYAHVLPGRSAAARRQIETVLGLPN
ncbi:MAG: hypothetical protein IPJ14_17340 [Kineosporiaceae bacterium]|nr:hypothetical protein [Kineosporiaceae bacterium]